MGQSVVFALALSSFIGATVWYSNFSDTVELIAVVLRHFHTNVAAATVREYAVRWQSYN